MDDLERDEGLEETYSLPYRAALVPVSPLDGATKIRAARSAWDAATSRVAHAMAGTEPHPGDSRSQIRPQEWASAEAIIQQAFNTFVSYVRDGGGYDMVAPCTVVRCRTPCGITVVVADDRLLQELTQTSTWH